jgi:drug/metabolite transporter (DMT)-like permease
VLSAVVIWGVFWLPLRQLDAAGLHGAWTSLAINVIATFASLPLLAIRSIPKPKVTLRLVLIGLSLGGAFVCYFVAFLLTAIVKVQVLFYMTPLWGTLFGIFLLGERLTLHRCIAMLSCAAGLVVVLGDGGGGLPLPDNAGDWLALAGGIIWSYGTTLLVLEQEIAPGYQCFAMFAGGLLVSMIAVAALPQAAAGDLPDLRTISGFLPELVGFSLIMFVPSNLFATWGSRSLSPGFVGLLIPMEIIVGLLSVAAFSGEAIPATQALGAILIVAGSAIDTIGATIARRRTVTL